MKESTAIILISSQALPMAQLLQKEFGDCTIFSQKALDGCTQIPSYSDFVAESFAAYDRFLFIGAMGICVRCIAPCVSSKYADPAVVCMDSTGQFVVPVLSGHVGGANEWARQISAVLGAQAVITTQSDCNGVWALDLLAEKFGWQTACTHEEMNRAIACFVNQGSVALLLDIKDKGTAWLERTLPPNVKAYYRYEDIPFGETELLIAVTPYEYEAPVQTLYYRPQVLHLGVGCKKQCVPDGIAAYIAHSMKSAPALAAVAGHHQYDRTEERRAAVAGIAAGMETGQGLHLFSGRVGRTGDTQSVAEGLRSDRRVWSGRECGLQEQ